MLNTKYNFPRNVVDITTVEPTSDNKSFVIDARLLDNLLSRITKGTLEDIKVELNQQIEMSETKDEMFNRLDEYIYLNKIINMIEESEPKEISTEIDNYSTKEVNKSY